jgi:hypothetical protein
VIRLHCVDNLAFVMSFLIYNLVRRQFVRRTRAFHVGSGRSSVVVPEPRYVPVKSSRREGKKTKSLVKLGGDGVVVALGRTVCVLVA